MNHHFKESILELYFDSSAYYYLQGRRIDYRKMIAFGAYGESGDSYFLFIYRDAFEKKINYGGILFLYEPYDLKQPVHVFYSDSDTGWERRNIYTRAAAFFLKTKHQNTLDIGEPVEKLYQEQRELIDAHLEKEKLQKEQFDQFDFNIANQKFQVEEIKPRPPQDRISPTIMRKLRKLKSQPVKKEETGPANARLGLSLILSSALGRYRSSRFQPLLIPIKKDGTYGVPRPAVRSQVEKYRFQDEPEVLVEFMGQLHGLSKQKIKDPARNDTISQIYFHQLSLLLLDMPDELTFYQLETQDSHFFPLKKLKIKKIEVQFAPSTNREQMFIDLVLTDTEDQVYNAAANYQVMVKKKEQVYLFFSFSQQEAYFGIPQEPKAYERFFDFLQETQQVSIDDFQVLLQGLQAVTSEYLEIKPEPLPLYKLKFHPTPILKILNKDRVTNQPERIEIDFDYETGLKKFHTENPGIQLVDYDRDVDFETKCLFFLKSDPKLKIEVERDLWTGHPSGYYFTFNECDDIDWLMDSSNRYLDKGFKIYSARQKKYIGKTGSTVRLNISHGINWLEFRPLLENSTTGETYEIDFIDSDSNTITDKRGTLHVVGKEEIRQLLELNRYAQNRGTFYRIPSANYFLINALYDKRMENIPKLKEQIDYARELQYFKAVSNYKLSGKFKGKLRHYQRDGFKWLSSLQDYRLGGCLADDMGLGKTVQTLALLQTLKDNNQLTTSLLVVPVSAIPNWELEIQKFTPNLTLYRHLGPGREKDSQSWAGHDLIITSYATLRNDIQLFKEYAFDYVILDESQAIKNVSSQVTKAVKILTANHRLALSGTPIENTSMELWSLLDFLMPGFLGTQQWFRSEWALPIEKYKNQEKADTLKQMIYPFILRRKKEDVERELPEKIELVESLNMDEEQVKLYVDTAHYYNDIVSNSIVEEGLEKSSFKILEGMLRLRQICLFPQLVDSQYKTIPSVKFQRFSEMLEDILSEGHKVLVFSQFVKVLGFIKDYLDKKTFRYSYLDGSMNAGTRGKMIKTFQEDQRTRIFLLSLKAGGVAINLTAADYVIIFDPWWNPAVEAQAIDRSHRIGQTKKVFVYRLVVKNTIEEKMLALQEQKRELMDKLITSETKSFKNLSKEDILNLFKF